MSRETGDDERLRGLVKTALVEVLEERQDLLREAVAEALEDIAMSRAIGEGERTPNVSRQEVFSILDCGQ